MNTTLSGTSYSGGTQVMLGWLSVDGVLRKGHADKWHSGQDPRGRGNFHTEAAASAMHELACARMGVSRLCL